MANIDRINYLAKKAKTVGLTPDEKSEQQRLREEYIAGFRQSLQSQLDHTLILRPDGSTHRLKRKEGPK